MSTTFAEQLRQISAYENASPFLLTVASNILQKLSRLPERFVSTDLSSQIREHALPVLESVREVAFKGWGSIHVFHQSQNLIILGLEMDYLGHSYRVLFRIGERTGDTLNLVGQRWETYQLKNWFDSNPDAWRQEVEQLLIKHYQKYAPPLENQTSASVQA